MSNCTTIRKESQESYVPIRSCNIYEALSDAYYGQGGFSPQLRINDRGISDRPIWQRAGFGKTDKSFLVPESAENRYITRVCMTVYYNYYAPIINSKVDPIFTRKRPNVSVTGSADHFLEWCNNVTGSGFSKSAYLQSAMRAAVRDGVCFLVMDREEAGLPYMYTQEASTVDPTQVKVSKDGVMEQIAFIGLSPDYADTLERITWTADTIKKETRGKDAVKDSWVLLSETPNPVGMIPVYPLFGDSRMDTYDYMPFPAQSYGLMMACYSIYESWSALEWVKHLQGHSKYIFANAEVDSVAVGADNAIKITDPVGSSATASILSPDPQHLLNHIEAIKFKVDELRRLASENGVDSVETKGTQAESGLSKSYTYMARADVLMRNRATVMDADQWIVQTYKEYYGAGSWESITDYTDSFSPKPSLTLAEQAEAVRVFRENNLTLGYRAALGKIARDLFGDDPEELQDVLDEIDVASVANDAGI